MDILRILTACVMLITASSHADTEVLESPRDIAKTPKDPCWTTHLHRVVAGDVIQLEERSGNMVIHPYVILPRAYLPSPKNVKCENQRVVAQEAKAFTFRWLQKPSVICRIIRIPGQGLRFVGDIRRSFNGESLADTLIKLGFATAKKHYDWCTVEESI